MRMHKWLVASLMAASLAAAQSPESLLIGPGDFLHVQVFDTPELEQHARVTDAGELPLILGGNVKVAHLAPADAARVIEKRLLDGHFLLNPRVLVSIDEYATQKVSVLGEVKTPGAYPINTPRSVLDVLTLAGGLTDLADRKILIERQGTGERVLYFVSNHGYRSQGEPRRHDPGGQGGHCVRAGRRGAAGRLHHDQQRGADQRTRTGGARRRHQPLCGPLPRQADPQIRRRLY